ncbi:telomerase protein component 1-like isoform X2 [Nyctibius grandis]|uniref:telomerase protein component 1-like isoform X2 n=1 Tax=Nyctibius grandis TaxID=48427 RepID=UPI0035BBB23D
MGGAGPAPSRPPPPGSLLEAAGALRRSLAAPPPDDVTSTLSDVLWDLVERGEEVETLLVLSPGAELPGAGEALACLRRLQQRPLRFVNVTPRPSPLHWSSRGDTLTLAGFNESVLRLLAEGDPAHLLAEVEAAPARYGLAPPPAPPLAPPTGDPQAPPPPPAIGPWRRVRVFVSSPFRDLGAERGALARAALPRLGQLGAPHGLGVTGVELRWGVAGAEERGRVTRCLEEVSRCDVIVGVLGERYGHVPQGFDPPGCSVTELELRTFLERWEPGAPPLPALIYIRDPAFLREVPARYRGDYEAESAEAAAKMAALKSFLIGHPGVAAVRSYTCRWAGSTAGALEGLVEQVVTDVWAQLRRHFLSGAPPPSPQAAFVANQQGAFVARSRLLVATAAAVRGGRGQRFLVTGQPGSGRSFFMAALVRALEEAPPPPVGGARPLPRCRVAYHFAGARPDQSDARVALAGLCAQLAAIRGHAPSPDHAPSGPAPYRELRRRLGALLAPPPGGGAARPPIGRRRGAAGGRGPATRLAAGRAAPARLIGAQRGRRPRPPAPRAPIGPPLGRGHAGAPGAPPPPRPRPPRGGGASRKGAEPRPRPVNTTLN